MDYIKNAKTAEEAFQFARVNKSRSITKWYKSFSGVVNVKHTPKFKLSKKSNFFTIGSCFARNVELHLRRNKVPLQSKAPIVSGEYFTKGGGDRNGYQNVYTPGSVLEFSRLVQHQNPYHSIVSKEGKHYDLLTHGLLGLNEASCREIRHGLIEMYRKISASEVIVITLGYNEAWYYKPDNSWVNRSPAEPNLRPLAADFQLVLLSYQQIRSMLAEAIENFRTINPDIKFILTVSPVPLHSTYSQDDILIANQRSKSALHAVTQDLCLNDDGIDYFPSYEIVTISDRTESFKDDGVHIKPAMLENVMKQFFDSYFS